jgi:hypothetical protein
MQLIDSKSILAKLMATENLTVEQRPVSTACFDVKNRVLTVPVLDKNISSQLYDLFMGHEVGHALYTPLESMMKARDAKVNMSVLNVVEDSRIERKIKNRYPGLRNSFVRAYTELIEKDFFETKGKDCNALNFIDRINLHCKGGAGMRIQFNEEERELLDEVETTETYDEVIDLTNRICEYMKQQQEEQEKKKKQKQKQQQEEEQEEDEEEGKEEPEPSPSDEEDDSEETEETDSEEEPEPQSDDDEEDEKPEPVPEEIRSYTDDAFHKNESQLYEERPGEYGYANVPKVDITEVIYDHKTLWQRYKSEGHNTSHDEYLRLKKESNKVVSYLVKEFELRKNADQMKRATVAKTGDLNMSKIFSYQFSEDIFKKVSVVPGGKSHGLVMFLDWSGSMCDHLSNTVKQLINLVMFCKKVNIPYEVYSIVDSIDNNLEYTPPAKTGDLKMIGFSLMNILSSRMTVAEYTYAASALVQMAGIGSPRRNGYVPIWMHLRGTPLNEAIISAMEIIPHFQKINKLQVVNTVFLTDGDGRALMHVYDDRKMYPYETGKYAGILCAPDITAGGKTHVVIRDTVSKHQEVVDISRAAGGRGNFVKEQTSALIKLLKARTKCNIIGFYIISGRDFNKKAYDFYPNTPIEKLEAIKDKFKKERYTIQTNAGFDEYYILRSNALDTDEEATLNVKDNPTTRGLVSAFSKYTSNRITNRVVLNRFIGLIS